MDCKNCGIPLAEEDTYCKSCGAKVIKNRLTIRNLWDDFCEQFLNYDNRFLKTFFGMFLRPHVVIGEYISGTRKKYVNVISYFAIALTFSGFQIFIIRKFYPESLDLSIFMPDSIPKEALDVNWVYDYLSIIALINLPLYGLIARLTFLGLKKFNYTEHLIVMTYLVAQFSIFNTLVITPLVIIFGFNFYVLGYISNFLLMLFTTYTYKKLYQLSLGGVLVRFMLFIFLAIALAIVFGILQFIYGVIDAGGFDAYMEKQLEMRKSMSYMASSVMNWTS